MKILNKFIWSKTEPKNKNDVWFDGSVFRLFKEEEWQAFTLPIDAAENIKYDDTEIKQQLTELSAEMQRMYEELKAMIQGGVITLPYAVLDTAILDQVILS